jgi:hypothetical protein
MLLLLTSLLTGCDEVSTEPVDAPHVEPEAIPKIPPNSGFPVLKSPRNPAIITHSQEY